MTQQQMIPHRLNHNERTDLKPVYEASTDFEYQGRKYTASFKLYDEVFLIQGPHSFYGRFDIIEIIAGHPNHAPLHTELYDARLTRHQVNRSLRKMKTPAHHALYFTSNKK